MLKTTNPEAAGVDPLQDGTVPTVSVPVAPDASEGETLRALNVSPAWYRNRESSMYVPLSVPSEILGAMVRRGLMQPHERSTHELVVRAIQKCIDSFCRAEIMVEMDVGDAARMASDSSWGHQDRRSNRRPGNW
jgi:hypothetical protein